MTTRLSNFFWCIGVRMFLPEDLELNLYFSEQIFHDIICNEFPDSVHKEIIVEVS